MPTALDLFSPPARDWVRRGDLDLAHLGSDILGPDWTVEEAVSRARGSSAATLGEVLLDQWVTAGIGNIYECESLWDLRLNPCQLVAETDDATLAALFGEARRLLLGSLAKGRGRQFPPGAPPSTDEVASPARAAWGESRSGDRASSRASPTSARRANGLSPAGWSTIRSACAQMAACPARSAPSRNLPSSRVLQLRPMTACS